LLVTTLAVSGALGDEHPAPSVPPAATAASPPGPEVTLNAVGDVTLGAHFAELLAREQKAGRLDRAAALGYGMAAVKHVLAAADLTIANLEGTFAVKSPRAATGFAFQAAPALAPVLVDGGIDVVSLGNNHVMDFGPGGVLETLAALDAVGIGWSGAGRDAAEARRPWIATVRGLRLGFLSYQVTGPHDVDRPPTGKTFRAAWPTVARCPFDYPCIRDLVQADLAVLAGQVDVPIVSFHWGDEHVYEPARYQIALGHHAVECGARVVLGSHPHVLQGVERHRDGVIFYSLGNFLFGGNPDPRDRDSLIARLTLGREGVRAVALLPVRTTDRRAPFQPTFLAEPDRSRVLDAVARRSRAFARTIDELGAVPHH
jgi:poly-gamma-glutamate synthesis protein (capsule biosynthesis protein)